MTPTTPPTIQMPHVAPVDIGPDLSSLQGSLGDLSQTLAMLSRHLQHHVSDMDPKALSHWHRQLGRIEDAIRALDCDYCSEELANRQYYDELACDHCLALLKARDGEA